MLYLHSIKKIQIGNKCRLYKNLNVDGKFRLVGN